MGNKKNKFLWFAVFIALVALTLHALTKQNKGFSVERFRTWLSGASMPWIVLAFCSMMGFVVFEGLAIYTLLCALGYKKSVWANIKYSALDIYFSAITPSATGGQPAAAYFMMKNRVPGAVTTVVLITNLALYTVSIILIGIVCLVTRPGMFMRFGILSRCLIVAGFLIQIILLALFILLVCREKIIMRAAAAGTKVLGRLRLMKHPEKHLSRLAEAEVQYKACATAIGSHKKALAVAFLFNFLQRLSLILVSVCVYIAMGGSGARVFDVFTAQGYVFTGSNSIPVPGAVGVADFLFIDGFSHLVKDPVSLELLSRGISFYSCLVLCAIISLCAYLSEAWKGTRKAETEALADKEAGVETGTEAGVETEVAPGTDKETERSNDRIL